MRIALLLNAQNFASSLLPELKRRGHDVELYTPYFIHLDKIGYRMNPEGSVVRKALANIRWSMEKGERFDLVLNYAYPQHPFKSPEIMYWQGVETWPEWRDRIPITKPGYYCTPDIAQNLPDGSILLPRAVNIDLFKKWARPNKRWNGTSPIRIGHFWKRNSIEASYTMRYWKKTDLLMEAIQILRKKGHVIELVEGPIEREQMPETLSGLHVLAEEFGFLSHGATAVEALIAGTPVVGSYNDYRCESPETVALMVNVIPTPTAIADGILKAVGMKIGSTRLTESYYHPSHAADVLEQTWEKLAR